MFKWIIYYVPIGYNGDVNTYIDTEDLCYDFNTDPLGLKAEVDRIFEEHPDDWEDYINWTTTSFDPKVTVLETSNVTEVKRVNIFNGTRVR